jgi:MoxR-like ATPase
VTGASIYSQKRGDFEFHPGPVFANLLLTDEVNRAPAKTQAALLEAMQERQVTIEGATYRLEPPFLVLATQNPIEYEGTYPLPEAQLDRFLLRISVGYPGRDDEALVLGRRGERRQERMDLEPVVDAPTLLLMQQAVERVYVSESVRLYMVDIVRQTRDDRRVQVGSSPRGSLALYTLGRARAVLRGRDFVTPEDVKDVAVPALAHRLTLRPELWVQRLPTQEVVRDVLDTVPTPPVRDAEAGRA